MINSFLMKHILKYLASGHQLETYVLLEFLFLYRLSNFFALRDACFYLLNHHICLYIFITLQDLRVLTFFSTQVSAFIYAIPESPSTN